jgi:hypothetical protein
MHYRRCISCIALDLVPPSSKHESHHLPPGAPRRISGPPKTVVNLTVHGGSVRGQGNVNTYPGLHGGSFSSSAWEDRWKLGDALCTENKMLTSLALRSIGIGQRCSKAIGRALSSVRTYSRGRGYKNLSLSLSLSLSSSPSFFLSVSHTLPLFLPLALSLPTTSLQTLNTKHKTRDTESYARDSKPWTQASMESLHTLDLTGNGIANIGAAPLGRNMSSTTSLRTLIVDQNPLMADGAASFASAIRWGNLQQPTHKSLISVHAYF